MLALGDSSYDEFCQTGLVLDQRLAELGAITLIDRVDCDVDFATPAAQWQEQILTKNRTSQCRACFKPDCCQRRRGG